MSRRDPFAPFFSVDGVPWWERVRWWAWVLIAVYGVSYTYYAAINLHYLNNIRIHIPPFEELQKTEGEVFFIRVGGKGTSGYLTGLKTTQGVKLFTCAVGPGDGPGCVYVTLVKELTGKPGTIWWYNMAVGPDEIRPRPLRIDVSGKTIVSYEKNIWYIEQAIPSAKLYVGYMGFLAFMATYITLYLGIRKHV